MPAIPDPPAMAMKGRSSAGSNTACPSGPKTRAGSPAAGRPNSRSDALPPALRRIRKSSCGKPGRIAVIEKARRPGTPSSSTRTNCPALWGSGSGRVRRNAATSGVSRRDSASVPGSQRQAGSGAPASAVRMASSTAPTASLWHIRISPGARQTRRPGASGHSHRVSPATTAARQEPQVPVAQA